jgi:hypothetical protein
MSRQAIPLETGATESRDSRDKSFSPPVPISNPFGLRSRIRRRYRFSVLRLLVTEIRSLGLRSRWSLRIRKAKLQQGDRETTLWMKAALIRGSDEYRRAYIEYMQHVRSEYPFLSVFDRLLLTQAWKAGSEWDDREHISQRQTQLEQSAFRDSS